MIRYLITVSELEAMIRDESPTWLKRARQRTGQHRKSRRFTGQGIWSDIKRVYMKLQHFKCAYCERALEENASANIEYDVEHFRPKGPVIAWPSAKVHKRRAIRYQVQRGSSRGYPVLAHSHLNYVVSCKVCNTSYKADHFPIEGRAGGATADDIAQLNLREKPFLPFPIGDWGDDPEQFLTFIGCMPVPTKRSGRNHLRAQVCIDFFELDTRGRLLRDRALVLIGLWPALEQRRTGSSSERQKGQKLLDALTADRSPHANCARAFVQLYQRDMAEASRHFEAAQELIARMEPALYAHLFP